MFSLRYLTAELLRRRGRALLTAVGLAVGVAAVVVTGALSQGLDEAQDEVLRPLTGVGTDMVLTRPLSPDGGQVDAASLSTEERRALREENAAARVELTDLGDPGERFERTSFVTTTQLGFPVTEAERLRALDGVTGVAPSLTLSAVTATGTVPDTPAGTVAGGGGLGLGAGLRGPEDLDIDATTVTGVDTGVRDLGPLPDRQVVQGRPLAAGAPREVVLAEGYARRKDLDVGATVALGGRDYRVVGLATTPLGGQSSDVYLPLAQLQRISDRRGRVNAVSLRAASADQVAAVAASAERAVPGASVSTSADVAGRVGGSLVDADELVGRLGVVLVLVALGAGIVVAVVLTLSSIAKRTREIGTLKALGWPTRRVVGQLTLESTAHGVLGAALGAVLGVGGATLVAAVNPTFEASVAGSAAEPSVSSFGSSQVVGGTTDVAVGAPVDLGLLLLAAALAVLGGLVAGAIGAVRAARLRPTEALRTT